MMMRNTQNLWKIDQSGGSWTLTFCRGSESFECGSPTHLDTPLALVLEFVEHNATKHDLVSVCGALYQLGGSRLFA